MTTLREEIYRLVYNHNEEQYGKCEECEYRTDLIIKIIEKRIDELWDSGDVDNTGRLEFYHEVKEILK